MGRVSETVAAEQAADQAERDERLDPEGWDLFPASQLLDHPSVVAEGAWDFYPLPTPRWDVACPCCGARRSDSRIQIREWGFHYVATSPGGHRCDVGMKCLACSCAWVHGVPVPLSLFQRHHGHKYRWRQGMMILAGEEVPDDADG